MDWNLSALFPYLTFLVIDACFGGTFDPLIARADVRGTDALYVEITKGEFIKRKLQFRT